MKLARLVAFVFAVSLVRAQTPAQPHTDAVTLASRTTGLQKHAGFVPYYWEEKKGAILFELSQAVLDRKFLYFTGMGTGLGRRRYSRIVVRLGARGCAAFAALACGCW